MGTAIIAAIPTVLQTAQSSGVFSTTNQKDPQRFAEAQQWYVAALAGDKDALCTLQHMTGKYGCETCGLYGLRCGHATDEAKAYDLTLYIQLQKVLSGQLPASTPLPNPPAPGGNTLGDIGGAATQTANVASNVATGLGQPTTPLGSISQTNEKLQMGMWIIGGVLLVGAIIYFARK